MITKTTTLFLLGVLMLSPAQAENRNEQKPITMEQLVRQLRIQGGNFQFSFDKPVFARVTTEVSAIDKPEKKEVRHFTTASANQNISLYFSASDVWLGGPPNPGPRSYRHMLIKLSDCMATEGTEEILYQYRFTEGNSMYSPSVPSEPQIGKQYLLHWYFKTGDPYSAKAVIEFSEKPFEP